MRNPADSFPQNHPVRQVFRTLTERGLTQARLRDKEILLYLADLLVDFMFVDNVYRMRDSEGRRIEYLVDMLERAVDAEMPHKKAYFKHLGDYSLFMLGMFPEHIGRSRRAVSPTYYANTGRAGYRVAGELERNGLRNVVFRKLSDRYEQCVVSLNWVREYSTDPFYQLMLREFEIT